MGIGEGYRSAVGHLAGGVCLKKMILVLLAARWCW
jgi:hypothetical protein